jgi:type IV pilus assembly protein PilO
MTGILNQFQGLNGRDPGAWPPVPKAMLLLVLFAAVLAAGYFLDWQAQLEELDGGRQQEAKLKQEYVDKKRQAVNLEMYRQQAREIESSFGVLLKQLPNRSQMEALLVDINQAGLGRGLQFEHFKPAPSESVKEFYAELPVSVKVTGNYHDMGAFASDIAQLSRIVTLNDIQLQVTPAGTLLMDSTAKTFRYLDDEELAAQRKKAKEAKAAHK